MSLFPDVLRDPKKGSLIHPFTGFRFRIQLAPYFSEAAFASVRGLTVETAVVPMQEGGNNMYTHQLKGQTKYTNITLKRGVTTDKTFMEWITNSLDGKRNERLDGTIELLDDTGKKVVAAWKFERAWPCKYEGPQFDAGASQAVMETLELAHEGLTRQQ